MSQATTTATKATRTETVKAESDEKTKAVPANSKNTDAPINTPPAMPDPQRGYTGTIGAPEPDDSDWSPRASSTENHPARLAIRNAVIGTKAKLNVENDPKAIARIKDHMREEGKARNFSIDFATTNPPVPGEDGRVYLRYVVIPRRTRNSKKD